MHGNIFALANIAMTCVTVAILKVFGNVDRLFDELESDT
jgi:hypothetical protein